MQEKKLPALRQQQAIIINRYYVVSAEWDKKTGMLEVAVKNQKTDFHKVHLAIANAGHDTDKQKATDEAYNKLHSCCKYDRKSEAAKTLIQK
jgi:hypothetical protein